MLTGIRPSADRPKNQRKIDPGASEVAAPWDTPDLGRPRSCLQLPASWLQEATEDQAGPTKAPTAILSASRKPGPLTGPAQPQ